MKALPYIRKAIKSGGAIGILLLTYYLIELVFSRGRDASEAATVDASALITILYSFGCLYVSYKICISTQYKSLTCRILANSPLKWIFYYTIWGGVTALWSVNLPMTAYRSIECLALMALMVAVSEQLIENYGSKQMLDWTSVFVFFSILLRLLLYFKRGASTTLRLGDDGTIYNCAQMIAPIFFYLPLYVQMPKVIKYTIYGFAIVSMSTVGYIGIAMGAISAFWGNKVLRSMAIVGSIVLIVLTLALGAENILLSTVFAEKSTVSFEETSGRDIIWAGGVERAAEKPIAGWGFAAGERTLVEEAGLMGVIGMHNCFMSAYVGCGLIGLFFMVMFWWHLLRAALSHFIPNTIKPLFIALYCGAFLESFANPGIGNRVYGSWMASTLVAVLICIVYTVNKYKFAKK